MELNSQMKNFMEVITMNEENKEVIDVDVNNAPQPTTPDEPVIVRPNGQVMNINVEGLNHAEIMTGITGIKRNINDFTVMIGDVVSGKMSEEDINKNLDILTTSLVNIGMFKITDYINFDKKEMIVMMAGDMLAFYSTLMYVELTNTEDEASEMTEADS